MNNLEQQIEAQREIKTLHLLFIQSEDQDREAAHEKYIQAMKAYNTRFKCKKYSL